MPVYKVMHVGNTEIMLEADRVVTAGGDVRFERLASEGAWKRVLQLPAASVHSIRRRVLEVGGARHFAPTEPLPIPPARRKRRTGAKPNDITEVVERVLARGPRDRDEIVSFASAAGIHPHIVETLRALPPGSYGNPADVWSSLPKTPTLASP